MRSGDFYSVNSKIINNNILYITPYIKELKIISYLITYDNINKAIDYIIRYGKELTELFYETYKQGCVLYILERYENEELTNEIYLFNSPLNYNKNLYVFSEESYKMVITEHFIYCSNFLLNIIPEWINYVLDGKLYKGCNIEHINNLLKSFIKKEDKLKVLEKFLNFQEKYKYNWIENN
jgi:hypothetical protein